MRDTFPFDEDRVEVSTEEETEEDLGDLDSNSPDEFAELQRYMRSFLRYPVLRDADEFDRLHHQYREGATEAARLEARDLIVYGNIRLVARMAIRRRGRGLRLSDMVQEGVKGLIRALERYNPTLGYRFSTYAAWWVRHALNRALQDMNEHRPYRIPVNMQDKMHVVLRAIERFLAVRGRWPDEEETFSEVHVFDETEKGTKLAAAMTQEEVAFCRQILTERYFSLDHQLGVTDQSERDQPPPHATIGDPKADVKAAVEARRMLHLYRAKLQRIEEAIAALPPREASIVRFRLAFGDFEFATLRVLGERYERSGERIRQLEEAALQYLEEILEMTWEGIEQTQQIVDELSQIAGEDPSGEEDEEVGHALTQPTPGVPRDPELVFGLLCEHIVLRGNGDCIVKLPVKILQIRASLTSQEAHGVLDELRTCKQIEGTPPWRVVRVIPQVPLPAYYDVAEDTTTDVDLHELSPVRFLPRPLPLPRGVAPPSSRLGISRRPTGRIAEQLTYRHVYEVLSARASTITGARVVRGPILILGDAFKIWPSDAVEVLEQLAREGHITPQDGWRSIVLSTDRLERTEPILGRSQGPTGSISPAAPMLQLIPGGMPAAARSEDDSSGSAALDTAIAWLDRQLPILQARLAEADERVARLKRAVSALRRARDEYRGAGTAVADLLRDADEVTQEFLTLLEQGGR